MNTDSVRHIFFWPSDQISCDFAMDMHLKKLMAANNQTISDEKRILEININHSLVSKVMSLDKNSKDKFSEILYDHAKLMEGENLDDPKKYTNLIAELVSL